MQIQMLGFLFLLLQETENNHVPFGAMRDLLTITDRTEHEGISFLTITLPAYYDKLMCAVERGALDPSLFREFTKKRNKPRLFYGLIDHMFDDSNVLKDDCPVWVFRVLRQVCYAFKKIKLNCAGKRVEDAIQTYVKTEEELEFYGNVPQDMQFIGDYVVSTLFPTEIPISSLVPVPGPGATAEGSSCRGNQKYENGRVASSIVEFFGESCCHVNEEWYRDDMNLYCTDKYPCVQMRIVPKTQKTPRIIAMEPSWTMMYQQGLKRLLYDRIESCWLTKGHVNFTDQTINQRLALMSSSTGDFMTIDLSEASDRVHNAHVISLFKSNRFLLDALQATRTDEVMLPNRTKLALRKFASMGSATCFPVESLVFYIGLLTGLHRAEGVTPTVSSIKKYSKFCWTYGDDLIAPSSAYSATVELFTSLGWKVNEKKSFYKSSFRESCGLDAYKGEDITPVYVRTPLTRQSTRSCSGYASLIATANQLFRKGYSASAEYIAGFIEKYTKKEWSVRRTTPDSGGIGLLFSDRSYGRMRWNNKLQRLEQWIPSIKNPAVSDVITDHAALFKSLTNSDIRVDHLERSVPRYAGIIRHSWISAESLNPLLLLLV